MATNAIPMTPDGIEQQREVVRRAGGVNAASALLGVSKNTIARALAGLPMLGISLAYLGLTVARVLPTLPGGAAVERTG